MQKLIRRNKYTQRQSVDVCLTTRFPVLVTVEDPERDDSQTLLNVSNRHILRVKGCSSGYGITKKKEVTVATELL